MLKRFSALNPIVKTLYGSADRETLRWTKRYLAGTDILPVPAAEVDGKIYQLAVFNMETETVILLAPGDIGQALALSVEIYGADTVTFAEWLNVYKKCAELNIDFTVMPLPSNIRNNLDAGLKLFAAAMRWNKTLADWLEQKNIPWKTLNLLAEMNDDNIGYITDYLAKTSPSLQSFRQFTESVADFADKLSGSVYDPAVHAEVTNRRSCIHREIDLIISKINSAVTAVNKDNWETSALHWSFVTKNAGQYNSILKTLEEVFEDVRAIYALLGDE
ncbi:MAG: hypothetical protein LBH05_02525 [Deferribacteraceae bacterium]|jgi:hypothetical protein|nr:hypothetical protein [Deferribacteraceae bacterium]